MPLLCQEPQEKKEDVRIRIDAKLKKKVDSYCQWAGIKDTSHFFAEAAKVIFKKDKEWVNHIKQLPPNAL